MIPKILHENKNEKNPPVDSKNHPKSWNDCQDRHDQNRLFPTIIISEISRGESGKKTGYLRHRNDKGNELEHFLILSQIIYGGKRVGGVIFRPWPLAPQPPRFSLAFGQRPPGVNESPKKGRAPVSHNRNLIDIQITCDLTFYLTHFFSHWRPNSMDKLTKFVSSLSWVHSTQVPLVVGRKSQDSRLHWRPSISVKLELKIIVKFNWYFIKYHYNGNTNGKQIVRCDFFRKQTVTTAWCSFQFRVEWSGFKLSSDTWWHSFSKWRHE